MTTHIKAILFDLDDTLFDRPASIERTLQLMVQEFPDLFRGIEVENIVRAFFSADDISMLEFNAGASVEETRLSRDRLFLRTLGLDESFTHAIGTFYVKTYPDNKIPIPGAIIVVKRLAKTYRLGIISNGPPDVQYRKLENLEIKQYFNYIVLSEELGIRKPDSRIFMEASGLLELKPEKCLYIGDSYDTDVVGAKNSGMQACWFNPRQMPLPRSDIIPDFEISILDQIIGILDCD